MGNPKETQFDENPGNSESYLRKGFNFTKRLMTTSNKEPIDLPEKQRTFKSVKEEVDNNNNTSYLKRAASYSAETSVGIYDWAFGSRKNTADENQESRAASVANSTISGLYSSLEFTKSIATGTYGYIFSNNNENKENSEKNNESISTTTYIKDLTTSGIRSSWGFMKSVVRGSYGLISSDTDKNDSVNPESKPNGASYVESSGAATIVKNIAVSGLSSTWGLLKFAGQGTYGLIFSSNQENPKQSKLDENENAVEKSRSPIEDIQSQSDGKPTISEKIDFKKLESKPIEPANQRNVVLNTMKEFTYWGLSSTWSLMKFAGNGTYGLMFSSNEQKPEQFELDENKNVVEKIEVTEKSENRPPIEDKQSPASDVKPTITEKIDFKKPESKLIEPANQPNVVNDTMKKFTYWGLSSSWNLMKSAGKGTYGLIVSSKSQKKERREESRAELPENKSWKIESFDRIETNPKFANFDIKNLPTSACNLIPVNSKNWWTKISQEQFQNHLQMDGVEILNKISKKAESKNFETIKEYGEWWNNLGNRVYHNFTFLNIETDSIVNKYFYRTSSHQTPKFWFDLQNDIPLPRPKRYFIYKKLPVVVLTSINKNIISYPTLRRAKKHLKICTCPIVEFPDHNLYEEEVRIDNIEIYDENETELRSTAYQEEELKTNIFRLKVLLGLALFYMILKT